MKIFVLSVSVWRANDYYECANTNPLHVDKFIFKSVEEAQQFALEALESNDEVYNDGTIYVADVDFDEVKELCLFDSEQEFWEGIRGNLHENLVANLVIEKGEEHSGCYCHNFNFEQPLRGAIVVVWQWVKYVGYARKCVEIRYAYDYETFICLTKKDKTFCNQMDIVMTADEVAKSTNLELDLITKLHEERDWRWTNPSNVDWFIDLLTPSDDV